MQDVVVVMLKSYRYPGHSANSWHVVPSSWRGWDRPSQDAFTSFADDGPLICTWPPWRYTVSADRLARPSWRATQTRLLDAAARWWTQHFSDLLYPVPKYPPDCTYQIVADARHSRKASASPAVLGIELSADIGNRQNSSDGLLWGTIVFMFSLQAIKICPILSLSHHNVNKKLLWFKRGNAYAPYLLIDVLCKRVMVLLFTSERSELWLILLLSCARAETVTAPEETRLHSSGSFTVLE